jgi:hypothetical protein
MNSNKHRVSFDVAQSIYEQIPAFTDVFDEETFYLFVFGLTVAACIAAFVASRFVTLKPIE